MPNNHPILAIKIDVDTERGTRIGVPNLVKLLRELNIPATFLFSLGPDKTGRAIKRVFRRGFFSKVTRTSVLKVYGLRTLLNGTLLPAPDIGERHAEVMRQVAAMDFEAGIHCYDHIRWQDGVHRMLPQEVNGEFLKAYNKFQHIFGFKAKTAGAPGWQANAKTLTAYDDAKLLYGSDTRGTTPFYPRLNGKHFCTLQIPTTLPTLDELLGLPDFSLPRLINYYLSLLKTKVPNVLTIHAELEGMYYLDWFKEFLHVLKKSSVEFLDLATIAHKVLENPAAIPICDLVQGEIAGRSGKVALQKFSSKD